MFLFLVETEIRIIYRKSSSTPPLAPNVRRRFPKTIKAGISGSHLSRQWINPISKLEEIEKNANVQIKKVELQPFSLWKPLATGISQLPLASAIDPNRGYKATLLRSPDRVIGLADATRQSSRTRTFGFSEAMAFAYVKDSRFVLLTCLLLGLGVWWYLLPEPLLVHPTACCSPEYASAIKEAAQCPMRNLGFPCIHPNQIHDQVLDTFTKPEVFDPLQLKPENRTVALAVMVGVIVLSVALGESITEQGIML